jgi:iron complex outermembrane receptor protein
MLINSLGGNELPGAFAEYARGSYEMNNLYGSLTTGSKSFQSKTGFQHQESNGYREHSQLRRNVLSWSGNFQFDSLRQLRTTFLYGDLHYQTPGALTQQEYDRDPKMSRPGNAAFPGAAQAGAAVQQKTFLAGASYSQQITSWLQSKSTFYGSFTQLHNPTIQNYGRSSEPHVGGRAVFKINRSIGSSLFVIDAGTEWQQGFTKFSIHDNKGGQADTLRMLNEVNTRQSLLFVQASWELKDWLLTLGVSNNQRNVDFRVFLPRPLPERNKQFDNTWTPRISLLKKWGQTTLYSSISKGFSPPTTEELFPTGGVINLELEAESGINYDAGIRTSIRKSCIWMSMLLCLLWKIRSYREELLVAEIFTSMLVKPGNAAWNRSLQYPLFSSNTVFENSLLWLSHTWHWFRYRDFQQTLFDAATGSFKTFNFSGNPLPGIPEHTVASGIDVGLKNGLFSSLTYYYNDKIPVNDANTVYAGSFHLVGARLGYQTWIQNKYRLKIVGGAENLLDEVYSLGNDINGFGGRYFNAAAGRNYYASLIFQWIRR